jgi:hypothetical protein
VKRGIRQGGVYLYPPYLLPPTVRPYTGSCVCECVYDKRQTKTKKLHIYLALPSFTNIPLANWPHHSQPLMGLMCISTSRLALDDRPCFRNPLLDSYLCLSFRVCSALEEECDRDREGANEQVKATFASHRSVMLAKCRREDCESIEAVD